jgi:hypothetical protein
VAPRRCPTQTLTRTVKVSSGWMRRLEQKCLVLVKSEQIPSLVARCLAAPRAN